MIFVLGLICLKSLVFVEQGYVAIVQRAGRYHSTLPSGVHWILPVLDSVVFRSDMGRAICLDLNAFVCTTRDRVEVSVDTVVYYRVIDGFKAKYAVQDYQRALAFFVETALVETVSKLELNGIDSETLESAIGRGKTRLAEWGLQLDQVRVQRVTLPAELVAARQQLQTEKQRMVTDQQRQRSELEMKQLRLEAELKQQQLEQQSELSLAQLRLEAQQKQQEIELQIRKQGLLLRLEVLREAKEKGVLDAYLQQLSIDAWQDLWKGEGHRPPVVVPSNLVPAVLAGHAAMSLSQT